MTSFDGDQSDGMLHVVVDDVDDALCKGLQGRPLTRPGHAADSRLNALHGEGHSPSEKESCRKSSEQDIRVGYAQLLAAVSVADRTGFRSRTGWSHFERAAGIELRDRPTTCAHCVDIDDRDAYRKSIDLRFVRNADAAFAKRDVGGCSTHIERNDVGITAPRRHVHD